MGESDWEMIATARLILLEDVVESAKESAPYSYGLTGFSLRVALKSLEKYDEKMDVTVTDNSTGELRQSQ